MSAPSRFRIRRRRLKALGSALVFMAAAAVIAVVPGTAAQA